MFAFVEDFFNFLPPLPDHQINNGINPIPVKPTKNHQPDLPTSFNRLTETATRGIIVIKLNITVDVPKPVLKPK